MEQVTLQDMARMMLDGGSTLSVKVTIRLTHSGRRVEVIAEPMMRRFASEPLVWRGDAMAWADALLAEAAWQSTLAAAQHVTASTRYCDQRGWYIDSEE